MSAKKKWFAKLALALLVLILAASPAIAAGPNAPPAPPKDPSQRLVIRAKNPTSYAALKADVVNGGGKVLVDHPEVNLMVVEAPDSAFKANITTNPLSAAVASDHLTHLVRPAMQEEFLGKAVAANPQQTRVTIQAPANAPAKGVAADPAYSLPGLMWNLDRVRAPQAWTRPNGAGSPEVLVGVADTGLDYTHVDLQGKVVSVVDFTLNEAPFPICQAFYGVDDTYWASVFGVAQDNDFNGHGSWIGGNIAGALNATGINGITPNVGLVALKISQWCGYAWDSTILDAFLYAADHQIDVVSISFGGYLDRAYPDQDAIYQAYIDVVAYARAKGTVIVASAGNEHTRIGAGGQVISHGILDVAPGGTDYYGLWATPGGAPGVIDVAATGNIVNGPSASCPPDSLAAGNHQWCKPTSDPHQATGIGLQNQLTYYSNYGPRIDVAAPGGARKFNVPASDRGGAEGWPWTGVDSIYGGTSVADGYNAWEAFSITSNYTMQIPCIAFVGYPGFPDNQCYSSIQGTSMAAPHVSAVLATIASERQGLRHKPDQLVQFLKSHTTRVAGNTTTAVSNTDTSLMDRTGEACPYGNCHLGGPVISDVDAYGAGLVDAWGPFNAK